MLLTTSAATPSLARAVPAAAPARRAWRHRFACLHVVATFVLLVAGASVTSHDAGISVEDWPTSLGHLNPLAVHLRGLMHGLVAIEHGHREVAMLVGLLTIVLAAWMWVTAERPAHRVLGSLLLAGVIVQGVLGGITVKLRLPPAVSVAHGMLAQTFFCLSIATAFVLSAEWRAPRAAVAASAARGLRRAALVAFGAVYAQLFLGALVRHTVAKWRVPTFLDAAVAVHAAFAAVVVAAIGLLVATVVARHGGRPRLLRPALALAALVLVQALLGVLAVVTRTDPLVTVLHVVTGAAILGVCTMLALRAFRVAAGSAP